MFQIDSNSKVTNLDVSDEETTKDALITESFLIKKQSTFPSNEIFSVNDSIVKIDVSDTIINSTIDINGNVFIGSPQVKRDLEINGAIRTQGLSFYPKTMENQEIGTNKIFIANTINQNILRLLNSTPEYHEFSLLNKNPTNQFVTIDFSQYTPDSNLSLPIEKFAISIFNNSQLTIFSRTSINFILNPYKPMHMTFFLIPDSNEVGKQIIVFRSSDNISLLQ